MTPLIVSQETFVPLTEEQLAAYAEHQGGDVQELVSRYGPLAYQHEPAIVTFYSTHAQVDGPLAYWHWFDLLYSRLQLKQALAWWIGDLLVYGENRWGEMYGQATVIFEKTYGTLANYTYVSSRVQRAVRFDDIPHSWHHTIAPYTEPQQRQLLGFRHAFGNRSEWRSYVYAWRDYWHDGEGTCTPSEYRLFPPPEPTPSIPPQKPPAGPQSAFAVPGAISTPHNLQNRVEPPSVTADAESAEVVQVDTGDSAIRRAVLLLLGLLGVEIRGGKIVLEITLDN